MASRSISQPLFSPSASSASRLTQGAPGPYALKLWAASGRHMVTLHHIRSLCQPHASWEMGLASLPNGGWTLTGSRSWGAPRGRRSRSCVSLSPTPCAWC